MLHRIIHNLRTFPQDVCYECNGTAYRNSELYRLICSASFLA